MGKFLNLFAVSFANRPKSDAFFGISTGKFGFTLSPNVGNVGLITLLTDGKFGFNLSPNDWRPVGNLGFKLAPKSPKPPKADGLVSNLGVLLPDSFKSFDTSGFLNSLDSLNLFASFDSEVSLSLFDDSFGLSIDSLILSLLD